MIDAAQTEGAELCFIRAEPLHSQLAALVAEGDSCLWDDPRWRRELAMWMHPARSGDGLAVPGFLARPAQAVVRSLDLGVGIAAHDRHVAEVSPLIAALLTKGDDELSWLAAGQALQRTLLVGAVLGLQASYLNQPCQLPPLRERMRTLLGSLGHPQLMLRVGVPSGALPPHTPRRRLVDVLAAPHDPAA
jgi:hypothetical protein